ncbi:hypothetical protein [Rhizobium sp. FY34]|uniref:hypothetical protein n=1 Tax=Rhizobium sp. FY34 TaxID=2562309 RepID=UPI001484FED3|nr:hypothetical protein [Rhizobium sp. FY34]
MPKVKTSLAKGRAPSVETGEGPGDAGHLVLSLAALLLACLANGESHLRGLCRGPDLDAACRALAQMGAVIGENADALTVRGVGNGALLSPQAPLDVLDAPVALALIAGLVAPYPMDVEFAAPVLPDVLIPPLRHMGVQISSAHGDHVTLQGPEAASPLHWRLDHSDVSDLSPFVLKAALLLAGLNTPGSTVLLESTADRTAVSDRLDAMFAAFGAPVSQAPAEPSWRALRLSGQSRLQAVDMDLRAELSGVLWSASQFSARGGPSLLPDEET